MAPEAVFFFDQDMEAPDAHACAGGTAVVVSSRSPLKEANEDSAALIRLGDDHVVLAVADGVGGLPSGEQASRLALESLAGVLLEPPAAERDEGGGWRAAIVDGIERANAAILGSTSGGTTLAVAEVRAGQLRTFHVGDSTILLTGQRGRMKMQTIAHSPVGYAVESGLLDGDAAVVHEARHVVSNVVGTDDMRIEIGPVIRLAPRDTLLLASDGLSDNLYEREIVEVVRKGPLPAAAARLRSAARSRMTEPREGEPSKPDDLCVVAFRLG